MKKDIPLKVIGLLLILCSLITGCHEEDEEDDKDKLNPYVDTPAYSVLTQEGSLHLFKISTFFQDPSNIDNDLMVLTFDNFFPASSNQEPDEDDNQNLNDLVWSQNSWDENTVNWLAITSPQSASIYQKSRQYRVLENNNLSSPITKLNRPVYEAIDENVYERQLAATFVWDLGNYTDEAGEDVGGEQMIDYETFYGFNLLDHASIWAENALFSNGAKIYGATRSVAEDIITVESVENNGNFTLANTQFGTGEPDIETALSAYPQNGNRMEYRFTLDYSTHSQFYISFDTTNNVAYLWQSQSGNVGFTAPYTLHSIPDYLEIDTSALTESARIILGGIPTYFKPVITGPYTDDGSNSNDIADKSYFYGKHYIKTTEINRLNLSPVFFLDPTAKSDIQSAFKAWRDERHLEEAR